MAIMFPLYKVLLICFLLQAGCFADLQGKKWEACSNWFLENCKPGVTDNPEFKRICGELNPHTAVSFASNKKDAVSVCAIQSRPLLVDLIALQAVAAGEEDKFNSFANVLLRPFLVAAEKLQLENRGSKGYYGTIESKASGNGKRRLSFRAFLPRDTSPGVEGCLIQRNKVEDKNGVFINFENQC